MPMIWVRIAATMYILEVVKNEVLKMVEDKHIVKALEETI